MVVISDEEKRLLLEAQAEEVAQENDDTRDVMGEISFFEFLEARDWLLVGAPVCSRNYDAKKQIKTIYSLFKLLPRLHPMFRWNSPEYKAWVNKSEE